jgi:hypothetical protein
MKTTPCVGSAFPTSGNSIFLWEGWTILWMRSGICPFRDWFTAIPIVVSRSSRETAPFTVGIATENGCGA